MLSRSRHAWALTSGRRVFSGHVQAAPGHDPGEVLQAAHDLLRNKFGFLLVTLQIEDRCLDEAGAEDIDIARGGAWPDA